tara:strand:- start:1393 stop:2970 length:1578 start_codon:yes stop_codon:yes gene_type:complete
VVRTIFYIASAVAVVVVLSAGGLSYPFFWLFVVVIPLILLGLYDIFLSGHNVLINYPVIGHLRYAFEFISPNIRQYFIETNSSGRPFNRLQRDLVVERAEGKPDALAFGTQYDVNEVGYHRANHSLAPKVVSEEESRVMVGGPACTKPYSASRLNISAMSFGALSANAIMALNNGARIGGFAHNTGEGGISPYHKAGGGDLIWQLGTGYFGCRTPDGGFDPDLFHDKSRLDQVKMIEIKLSQGAKPAHGGVLPAAKITPEIAEIRGVPMGVDCISPPAHRAFSTPQELLQFVQRLRELSGGKPIGFKLCVGRRKEFMGICRAMIETGIKPDFITVDGAEGGTGAAPIEYSDRLGMPILEGLVFVQNCLVGAGLRDDIKVIASAKTVSGFDMVLKIALGADMVNAARTMMFAVGCIQALRCHLNTCPTGVATQDHGRARAVDVDLRQLHVANYHRATVKSLLELVGAIGLDDVDHLGPRHIYRRVADQTEKTYAEIYDFVPPNNFLGNDIHAYYKPHWDLASAAAF